MKVVNHEKYNLLLERNCKKGKHRIRENKFGVCWCTICGLLSSGEVPDKLEEDGKLLIINDYEMQELNKEDKDLCKTCEHYWQDFPMPCDHVESHCEILDNKPGLSEMDNIVPYPCLKCPFDSYSEKIN